MKKNKLIICSGDSFTFGDEVGADYLVPTYTSNLYFPLDKPTEERSGIHKKLMDELDKIWKNPTVLYPIYEKACKDRAWPSHLKKITGYNVINCARGGISNDEIVYRAMFDFHEQKQNFEPRNITIMLMLTNIHRVGYPVYGTDVGRYKFQSFIASTPREKIKPPYMQPLYDFYFKHLTDIDHLWRSASQIIAVKHYFESFGSRVIFLDSCLWQETSNKLLKENYEKVSHIHRLIKIESQMSDFTINTRCVLPGYHYNETVHQKFAEYVATIL